jgi:hypothetical protein
MANGPAKKSYPNHAGLALDINAGNGTGRPSSQAAGGTAPGQAHETLDQAESTRLADLSPSPTGISTSVTRVQDIVNAANSTSLAAHAVSDSTPGSLPASNPSKPGAVGPTSPPPKTPSTSSQPGNPPGNSSGSSNAGSGSGNGGSSGTNTAPSPGDNPDPQKNLGQANPTQPSKEKSDLRALLDRIHTLTTEIGPELRDLKSKLHAPTPPPTGSSAPAHLFTDAQKEPLLRMINTIEQAKESAGPDAFGNFKIIDFLNELEKQGFFKFRDSECHFDRHSFRVVYEDAHGQPVMINRSCAPLVKEMRRGWLPTLGAVTCAALGATVVGLGVATFPVLAAASVGLLITGIKAAIVNQRVVDQYKAAFDIPLELGPKSVLSPEKMILETLATYHLIKGIPGHARKFNLVGTGPANDTFTSLEALLRATKNTITCWDQFRHGMPSPSTGLEDKTKVANLRTLEFDANIDKYKALVEPLSGSYLRWHNWRDLACDIGLVVGTLGGFGSAVAIIAGI